MSTVLMVSAAFAVDLGQQRVVRRDVQAVADMVALDLARELNGGKANAYDKAALDAVKNASVARNSSALGGRLANGDVTWEFVKAGTGGHWEVIPNNSTTEVPTAVRVAAKSDTAFAFGGVTGTKRGEGSRSAVASSNEASVCFSVGTNLLDLNTSNNFLVQLLENMLGINLLDVSTSVVGPGGIVALQQAQIPLIDLSAALGVGTVDGLVTSDDPITIGELLSASAVVLRKEPASLADISAAAILDALVLQATLATPTLVISEILDLGPNPGSALTAELGVLDLLNAVVYVAGQDAQGDPHAVGASLPLNLGSLGTLTTDVSIIAIPKIACGNPNRPGPDPVEATSAQIELTTTLNLPAGAGQLVGNLLAGVNNLLEGLLGGLLGTHMQQVKPNSMTSRLRLTVTAAKSKATLKSQTGNVCSSSGSVGFDVLPSVASVTAALDLRYQLQQKKRSSILALWPANWTDLPPVDSTLLGLHANVGDPAPYAVTLNYPAPPAEEMPYNTKAVSPLNIQFAVTSSDESFIGGIVGNLLAPVLENLVRPVVNILNAALLPALTSLLGKLGIELGKTTLKASGRPGCGTPKLVG
ncbi:hypothetical protein KVF89_08065 [Nocardioides carbamazepini]|uniref:hypothetical protein n=1 Tax=Nocardioides carbamazepini TaxID=2854259 RepID=UPI002149EFB2|nr:hypothetical protein [Nocardioides carbamazepini]MCR1782485.1 hypothetical protein [Nocardioides carbamazepini]